MREKQKYVRMNNQPIGALEMGCPDSKIHYYALGNLIPANSEIKIQPKEIFCGYQTK